MKLDHIKKPERTEKLEHIEKQEYIKKLDGIEQNVEKTIMEMGNICQNVRKEHIV